MSMEKSMTELFDGLTEGLSAAEVRAADIISDISSKIVIERCNRDMTQKEFAKFMGVSQGMVSKWEGGDYNFTIETLCSVLDKLGLDCKFEILGNSIGQTNVTINTSNLINIASLPHMSTSDVFSELLKAG